MPALRPLLVVAATLLLTNTETLAQPASGSTDVPPTVVLVSFDGFRWDYPAKYETPHLDRLAAEGVRARRLLPVFPTKTFPNHYTLVTGLYPAHHGIVANTMYDPELDASFSLGARDAVTDARWWHGEPLWVTAEKQGQRAATFFWPGSEAPIGGVRPTYWKVYDGRVPGEERVRQVLRWLDLPPDERPQLVTLYFSRVDTEGHRHGPDAPETAEAVRAVDALLGTLLDGLDARSLTNTVHVIVVSDHGMAATSPDRVIFVDDYVDLAEDEVVTYSPVLGLHAEGERAAQLYDALQNAHPRLRVYRRGALPARLHYEGSSRIPDLIGLADEGWSVTTRDAFTRAPQRFRGGTHGYDPDATSMHGIFYARGPGLAPGATVDTFRSIDLYALATHLLGLTPAPHDGDPHAARRLLQAPGGGPSPPETARAADTSAYAADVRTPDALISALYDVISGPQGQPRNWARFRHLFAPDARLVAARRTADADTTGLASFTVGDFIETVGPFYARRGFFEREVARTTDRFGAVLHVFSTYETRYEAGAATPDARGLNSIQLFHDGRRWWIVTVYWDSERDDQPIPAEYLPSDGP